MPAPVALVINFTFALVAYVLFARWYIVPAIAGLPPRRVLPPLLLVHLVRPVSLWLLVPGVVVRPTLPESFATGTAYGDLIATTLALIAAVLVRYELKGAIAMTWIFNVVGLVDALRNCAVGMMTQAPTHMGAGVFIPAFGVPLLLVSHALIFKVLLDQRRARK